MRYTYLTMLLLLFLLSCETNSFDSDKRQLVAKDEIRRKLGRVREFDVLSFKEDTFTASPDSNFINPIRYTLKVSFKDSTGALQTQTGTVIFTPNGKSIIGSRISGINP